MLSFALGRGLESYDLPTVRKITAAVERDGFRSDTLIQEIVKSYPFQYREPEGAKRGTSGAPVQAG